MQMKEHRVTWCLPSFSSKVFLCSSSANLLRQRFTQMGAEEGPWFLGFYITSLTFWPSIISQFYDVAQVYLSVFSIFRMVAPWYKHHLIIPCSVIIHLYIIMKQALKLLPEILQLLNGWGKGTANSALTPKSLTFLCLFQNNFIFHPPA